jgi:hypothetical protein
MLKEILENLDEEELQFDEKKLYIYKDQNVTVSRDGDDFNLNDVDTGETIYAMDRDEFKNFLKFKSEQ